MFDSAHANGRWSSAVRIATTALITALLVATTTMASAQGTNAGGTNQKALVGSWLETVTFPPETGRPPLKSLGSFHGDHTMVCSDQGAVTTEPPSVFTSCHGAWTHLEGAQVRIYVVRADLGPGRKPRRVPQGARHLHGVSVRE